MKLLLIRHGGPDYTIDSLTPKGHVEAELLAERLSAMGIKGILSHICISNEQLAIT